MSWLERETATSSLPSSPISLLWVASDSPAPSILTADLFALATRSQLPPIRQALISPVPQYPLHPSYTPPPPDAQLLSESILSKLLIFTEHKDTIRRGGVLSTLKHVAMSAQTHALLITPESEIVNVPHLVDDQEQKEGPVTEVKVRGIDIVTKVLGPLMGGEEIDIDVRFSLSLTHFSLQAGKYYVADLTLL